MLLRVAIISKEFVILGQISRNDLETRNYWLIIFIETIYSLRHWSTGLVSSRVSLTSWGEGALLAMVDHPSSDGIIKIPDGVDVLLYPGVDTGCFRHHHTDFRHTNLGVHKFNYR